jgi:hypothetical protein
MDPLAEILDVEQEGARRLAEERAKVMVWLADAKQRAALAIEEVLAELKARAAADDVRARADAAARAAAAVADARAYAAHVAALDDHVLRSLVWKHLTAIVPGPNRDREDVEDRSDRAEGPAVAGPRDDPAVGDDADRCRHSAQD